MVILWMIVIQSIKTNVCSCQCVVNQRLVEIDDCLRFRQIVFNACTISTLHKMFSYFKKNIFLTESMSVGYECVTQLQCATLMILLKYWLVYFWRKVLIELKLNFLLGSWKMSSKVNREAKFVSLILSASDGIFLSGVTSCVQSNLWIFSKNIR